MCAKLWHGSECRIKGVTNERVAYCLWRAGRNLDPGVGGIAVFRSEIRPGLSQAVDLQHRSP
jgi:hypothetical protein